MTPERADILIVGAGIIGLTLARELVAAGHGDILVIEKEPEPGKHASGRNSGVLHAGIYYSPDSLKAQLLPERQPADEGVLPGEGAAAPGERARSSLPGPEEELATSTSCTAGPRPTAPGGTYRRAAACRDRAQRPDRGAGAPLSRYCRGRPQGGTEVPPEELENGRAAYSLRLPADRAEGERDRGDHQGEIGFRRSGQRRRGTTATGWPRLSALGGQYRLIPFKGLYRMLRPGAPWTVNGNIYPVPDIRNPFLGVHFSRSVPGTSTWGPPPSRPSGGRTTALCPASMPRPSRIALATDAVLFLVNPRFRERGPHRTEKIFPVILLPRRARLVKSFDGRLFAPARRLASGPSSSTGRPRSLSWTSWSRPTATPVHVLNPISPAFTSSMDLARRWWRSISGKSQTLAPLTREKRFRKRKLILACQFWRFYCFPVFQAQTVDMNLPRAGMRQRLKWV